MSTAPVTEDSSSMGSFGVDKTDPSQDGRNLIIMENRSVGVQIPYTSWEASALEIYDHYDKFKKIADAMMMNRK